MRVHPFNILFIFTIFVGNNRQLRQIFCSACDLVKRTHNTATRAVIATVRVGRNPLDVTLTPDGARASVANAGSNSVSVINTGTNTVIATVPVGAHPLNVAITPDGASTYVADAGANSVTVIKTATNTVVNNLRVGANPVD